MCFSYGSSYKFIYVGHISKRQKSYKIVKLQKLFLKVVLSI